MDDRTYEAVDTYSHFGEVIVSTWSDEDLSLLDKASKPYKLVISKYPPNLWDYQNEGSRYYMAQTTLAGAMEASLEYVMKTRSDELYPDMEAMIENLKKYPDRSHTTDNGFWRNHRGCYANHLFIDKAEHIRKAMQMHVSYCDKSDYNDLKFMCSEQSFGYFLMAARGCDMSRDILKLYYENVWITRSAELKGHLHSGQTANGSGFKRSSLPYPSGRMDVAGSHTHNINNLYQHIEELS